MVKNSVPFTTSTELVRAYGHWIQQHIDKGYRAYLVTFMFTQLSGNSEAVQSQMIRAIENGFYSQLIKRVVRKPRSSEWQSSRPLLIGCPDTPVHKFKRKQQLIDAMTNEGLHFHAIIMLPKKRRFSEGLIAHVRDNENIYVGCNRCLQRIDVRRIQPDPEHRNYKYDPQYVTGYGLKSVQNGKIDRDKIVILPKSSSEVSEKDRRNAATVNPSPCRQIR